MGSLIPPELTLDCGLSSNNWAAKPSGAFVAQVLSSIRSSPEKISKLDDYVNRLQDEMKKIDAFKRELPLCMLLLNDAIAKMKEELVQCGNSAAKKPITEEFIPLKKSVAEEDDEKIGDVKEEEIISSREKMNWMSSVQLWNSDNQDDKPSTSKLDTNKKRKEEVINRSFEPFKRSANFPATKVGKEGGDEPPLAAALSLATPEMKYSKEEIYSSGFSSKSSSSRSGSSSESNFKAQQQQQQQAGRKQRRCWSPELHRRFINALEHLGGPQAATPKQIRELMQVDGLTNDEVKSHLQKYRLHTRRAAPTTTKTSTIEPVVLGNLYMSQEQCNIESSKKSNSNSGSPPGPLHLVGSSRANSVTTEGEEDEKSESHSWIKSTHNHLSGRV